MAKPQPSEAQLEAAADVAAAIPSNLDAPISTNQLIALLAKMSADQQSSTAALASAIVEGLKESQKPYEDPRKAENEKMFRDQNRRIEEQKRSNDRAAQEFCPHIAGCNGLSHFKDYMGRTCIIKHTNDVGETIGLCTNCQREFRTTDHDYMKWMSQPSINQPSGGGQRNNYFARTQASTRIQELEAQLAEANAKKLEVPAEA